MLADLPLAHPIVDIQEVCRRRAKSDLFFLKESFATAPSSLSDAGKKEFLPETEDEVAAAISNEIAVLEDERESDFQKYLESI